MSCISIKAFSSDRRCPTGVTLTSVVQCKVEPGRSLLEARRAVSSQVR